ncbi:MAG TPA: hypothetical protein VER58_19055 [Thermoanaerobaculia bacterium]|nr:hypothetical protein [Thermoanaerobaculia bacterium]
MSRIIFLALQTLGIALFATGLVTSARDPWDPGCGTTGFWILGLGFLLISIAPAAVMFKRPIMFVVIALTLIEVAAGFGVARLFYTRVIIPKRQVLVLSDPARFVADARQLMAATKEEDQKGSQAAYEFPICDMPSSFLIM